MKIIIAEDDSVMQRKLDFLLSKAGYEVIATRDGLTALETIQQQDVPILALVDVQMPRMDGIQLCQTVRLGSFVVPPYLIIITIQGGRENIIRGLNAGADDYIIKPFDAEELQARIHVGVRVLELQQKLAERVKELEETLSRAQKLQGLLRMDTHVYEFGPFRLEATERRLLREGQTVPLSARTFDLLLLLVQNSGHLVAKGEIMQEVWPDSFVEENNLTVTMSTLRKALGDVHGEHLYIQTMPKRGYRFVAKVREIEMHRLILRSIQEVPQN